jgi:hypothetical protein
VIDKGAGNRPSAPEFGFHVYYQNNPLPVTFMKFLFLFSLPFWLAGAFVERFLPHGIPINPLMTFNLMLVARALEYALIQLMGKTIPDPVIPSRLCCL